MRVNFYATLRQLAGRKEVDLDLAPGATVQHLLDGVLERFPAMREELLDGDGRLRGHVHIFINGRDAPYLEHALETKLAPGDRIDVFPAVAGG